MQSCCESISSVVLLHEVRKVSSKELLHLHGPPSPRSHPLEISPGTFITPLLASFWLWISCWIFCFLGEKSCKLSLCDCLVFQTFFLREIYTWSKSTCLGKSSVLMFQITFLQFSNEGNKPKAWMHALGSKLSILFFFSPTHFLNLLFTSPFPASPRFSFLFFLFKKKKIKEHGGNLLLLSPGDGRTQ